LLDEVILERQRLFVVGNDDVVDVDRLAYQRAGLGVRHPAFVKIGADPVSQAFRLADIDDLSLGVLVQIHAGRGRDGANFLLQVHGKRSSILEEGTTDDRPTSGAGGK
jgi:hypothetical protein